MKNIHVIATDKPSRIYSYKGNSFLTTESHLHSSSMEYQNIYITSGEEIKERDWVIQVNFEKTNTQLIQCATEFQVKIANDKDGSFTKKKIILTTDQDLIKDGVQSIDDEFLEWFVKNPSCEEVEVEIESKFDRVDGHYHDVWEIIIPKEEPNQDIIMELQKDPLLKDFDNQVNKKISFLKQKQETLEESTLTPIENKLIEEAKIVWEEQHPNPIEMALFGFKWQKEQDNNKYSDEDVIELLKTFDEKFNSGIVERNKGINNWFEQFKKK